jgi:wyosine [tRNA(Phe)-imidazoG37] synthetase (radical SAM superfamily)
LGKINVHTTERKIYVPTERVMTDLLRSSWRVADIITLSGSGEPTLAANLGEVIQKIKMLTAKPVLVLTNATTLSDESVRYEICEADKIFCKLDATDEETFRLINRPVEGITVRGIVEGIKALRREFNGEFAIQLMLTTLNMKQMGQFARILKEISPDEVQLNLPLRPVPREWFAGARGNNRIVPVPKVHFRVVEPDAVARVSTILHSLTGLKITTVPRRN